MAKTDRLRLRDIHVGDVFVLHNPERIGKVISDDEEVEVIDKRDRERPRSEINDALLVQVTLPTLPIPNMVTDRAAQVNKRLLRGLCAAPDATEQEDGIDLEDSEVSTGVWQELWTERMVPGVVQLKGTTALAPEGPFVSQVYCHEERQVSTRQHSSSALYRPIEGDRVPPEIIPAGIFPGDVVVPPSAPEAPAGPTAIAEPESHDTDYKALPWPQLRSLAFTKGLPNAGKLKRAEILEALGAA